MHHPVIVIGKGSSGSRGSYQGSMEPSFQAAVAIISIDFLDACIILYMVG